MAIPEDTPTSTLDPPARTTNRVLLLCFLTIVTEGYDIGVMGTIVPSMLADQAWQLTPVQTGAMGSAALFGTLFGAYFISILTDLVGRKRLLITCVALFSLSMLGACAAPTPFLFALMRFIGGLGLGGVISAAAALTVEYSPAARRNLNFALMYSGYSIGALLSALAGIAFLAAHGWRFVVGLGALPLLGIPALIMLLPESLAYLVASGRRAEARALASRFGIAPDALDATGARAAAPSLRALVDEVFSRENVWSTLCLWVAQIAAMLMVYGLGTWLPQLMRKLGYDLGSSLSFLAMFMLSCAAGGILIGRVSDRLGPRRTMIGAYAIGAVAICLLTLKGSLATNYLLVALAGFGSIGVAMVQLGYIANFYRPFARAGATGWAVGIGRLGAMAGPMTGGWLAASPHVWTAFAAFACAGLVAALGIGLSRPKQA